MRKTIKKNFSSTSLMAKTMLVLFFVSVASSQVVAGNEKSLKVFILAGQSNMQGHAHVRTFDAMRLNPRTAPILKAMKSEDGSHYVCKNVWISSIGSSDKEESGRLTSGFGSKARGPKIGPEFTFGIYLEKLIDEPVLIIKTAWGGKSLHSDFRPPSAGPYKFSVSQLEEITKRKKDVEKIKSEKIKASGFYYRAMINHVKKTLSDIEDVYPEYDPDVGYELAGFVWFQGWNDMVDRSNYPNRDKPDGYQEYSRLLNLFVKDVRNDLSVKKLPFVIGVMGVGGPTNQYKPEQQRYKAIHQNFRDAMAAPVKTKEFQGNVAVVLTENFWDMEVVRLRKEEKKFKPQIDEIKKRIKAREMTKVEGKIAMDAIYGKHFDMRELEILQKSTSNFDFHYMGSAGIVAQIGKGFAETMIDLLEVRQNTQK